MRTHPISIRFQLPAALAIMALAASASAQQRAPAMSPEARREACALEVRYVKALNEAGFPDYAELVLKDVKAKFPEAGVLLKVAELEQYLRLRKFDEAEKIIKAEPNQDSVETWAMRLTMSDYLYSSGRYPEALGTYEKLFAKYKDNPPAEIVEFYVNSAYKYAQMLLFLNRQDEGIESYRTLLKLKDIPQNMRRQATFELAELLVKKADAGGDRTTLLAEAKKNIDSLLWVQDLWFGRAVALMAHIQILKGDVEKAQKTIETYRAQLESFDDQLREQGEEMGEDLLRLSPLAESTYLVGTLLQGEGEKILAAANGNEAQEEKAVGLYSSAIEKFMTVYVNYPSFAFAPDAMNRQEKLERELDRLGYEIESNITPAQRRNVANKQFSTANSLYHQKQLESAIDLYAQVLKNFPEVVPDSINALSVLVRCFVEFGESKEDPADREYYTMMAEAASGYLAERFARSNNEGMNTAGNTLLALSQYFAEHNLFDAAETAKTTFFKLYPEHTLAAQSIMGEAKKKFTAETPDYEGALKYYEIVVENYPKKNLSYDAQRRQADCLNKLGRFDEELVVRSNYLARVERRKDPGAMLVSARYSYAKALRALAVEELKAATQAYDDLRRNGGAAPVSLLDSVDAAPAAEGEAEAEDPTVAAVKRLKAANAGLVPVINAFTKIEKLLSDPKVRPLYESNSKEKETNDLIYQAALYDRAYCFSALNQPEASLPKYKKRAIEDYEKILELYPETENAPAVLMQLGSLYSTLRTDDEAEREANAKKATAYFDRLSKDYPTSEQAKNVLFLQGKTLLELGFRREGVAKFREMIGSAAKYSAFQLATAAEELYNAKEYDAADQAYAAASAGVKPEDAALVAKIDIGKAKVLYARGDYPAAADAFAEFVKNNPKSARVIEANELLCKSCVQATLTEKDVAKRDVLFNRAIDAVKALRAYKKGAAEQLALKLELGDIMEAQIKVETDAGNAEFASRCLAKSAMHYQSILMSTDRDDAELRPVLERVFPRYTKALLQMKTYSDGSSVYQDVIDACEEYLKLFPEGKHSLDIRNNLSEAKIAGN